jgi:DNA-binding CsgD family transcriptional regulator
VDQPEKPRDTIQKLLDTPLIAATIRDVRVTQNKVERLRIEGAQIRSMDEFKAWTRNSIRPILPHEALCCGFGRLNSGFPSVDGIVSIDYPVEFLDEIRNNAGGLETPLLRNWLNTQQPQLFDDNAPSREKPSRWLLAFRKYNLQNAASHAVFDSERCIGTYYSFHRIPGGTHEGLPYVLEQIVPILHDALCRVLPSNSPNDAVRTAMESLTPRELDILAELRKGHSNREIAATVCLSENTVKHHLMNIFKKFGNIENRVQLVRLLVEYDQRASMAEYGIRVL